MATQLDGPEGRPEGPSYGFMFCDKDYILSVDGLLFNVLGYDHPQGRTACHLRYVGGKKWTGSYHDALDFLRLNHPVYIDPGQGLISVPHDRVSESYQPDDGLRRIVGSDDRNRNEETAVTIATHLARHLQVPFDHFGVTDSLLWGHGHDDSDVDLVVYGRPAAQSILALGHALFEHADFEPFPQAAFTKPAQPELTDNEFSQLCQRKANLGYFQGRRFSLRAVRKADELPQDGQWKTVARRCCQLDITDNSESLFFPAVYQTNLGIELVSFWMLYESVFHVGETVEVSGMTETGPSGERLVVGSLKGQNESIRPSR